MTLSDNSMSLSKNWCANEANNIFFLSKLSQLMEIILFVQKIHNSYRYILFSLNDYLLYINAIILPPNNSLKKYNSIILHTLTSAKKYLNIHLILPSYLRPYY